MEQLTGLGFLHIKNVDGFDEQAMLKAAKDFFNIPESEKHKLKWRNHNKENKNIYRGLAPFVDNDVSHKELFDMGYPYELLSEEAKKYPL
jgi:isopenicillin N synthase-like dioxygenase